MLDIPAQYAPRALHHEHVAPLHGTHLALGDLLRVIGSGVIRSPLSQQWPTTTYLATSGELAGGGDGDEGMLRRVQRRAEHLRHARVELEECVALVLRW